jgi:predicted Holliday junction resolvase-like endonuclease
MTIKALIVLMVALCALVLLLIKQLFEKQAQLDTLRGLLEQAEQHLAERSPEWGPSEQADEWVVEKRRLSNLEYRTQTSEQMDDLKRRVREARAAASPPDPPETGP